ncbi:MAG: hypothetical protein ACE5I1_21475 [bacterium]
MKAKVILNEQHTLQSEQKKLLDKQFGKGNWQILPISKTGLTLQQQHLLSIKLSDFKQPVVFMSTIPFLLAKLAINATLAECRGELYLFHADVRTAEETKKAGGEAILKRRLQKKWQLVLLI